MLTSEVCFINKLQRGGIMEGCTLRKSEPLCSFYCFTKQTESFIKGSFISFGMSPWLLGTDSGGPYSPEFHTETASIIFQRGAPL